jgi:hypothetical protein
VFPNSQWAGGPGGSGRRWSWGLDRRRYRLTSTSARTEARTGKATREGAIVVVVSFEREGLYTILPNRSICSART